LKFLRRRIENSSSSSILSIFLYFLPIISFLSSLAFPYFSFMNIAISMDVDGVLESELYGDGLYKYNNITQL